MGDVVVFLFVASIAAIAGIGIGMLFIAPRIARALDRHDEEPGARNDRDA